jgi:hypothetical protein
MQVAIYDSDIYQTLVDENVTECQPHPAMMMTVVTIVCSNSDNCGKPRYEVLTQTTL